MSYPSATAEILNRVWIAGVIPIFVGVALIINGLFVSRKLVEIMRRAEQTRSNTLENDSDPPSLRAADTTQFSDPSFSVTEETTKHLRSSDYKQ